MNREAGRRPAHAAEFSGLRCGRTTCVSEQSLGQDTAVTRPGHPTAPPKSLRRDHADHPLTSAARPPPSRLTLFASTVPSAEMTLLSTFALRDPSFMTHVSAPTWPGQRGSPGKTPPPTPVPPQPITSSSFHSIHQNQNLSYSSFCLPPSASITPPPI